MISVESSIIDVAQLLHALPRGRWDYCTWLLPFTEVGRGGTDAKTVVEGGRSLHLRGVHEPAIKPDRRWKGDILE